MTRRSDVERPSGITDIASSRPYVDGWKAYIASGLGSPLPLPPGLKFPPRKGFTGWNGKVPTTRRYTAWARDRAAGNLALRLAPGVLGLDVDAYDDKAGARTLGLAVEAWGPLPLTYRSSARPEPSGIYLFKVPEGIRWRGEIPANLTSGPSGHIELIHYGHRYLTTWPSIHPEGMTYRWHDPAGEAMDGPPHVSELPDLPAAWIEALMKPTLRVAPPARTSAPHTGMAKQPSRASTRRTPPANRLQLEELAERVRTATEGSRNEVLHTAAMHAGGAGHHRDIVQKHLLPAATACGLDSREAIATIVSGWTYGAGKTS